LTAPLLVRGLAAAFFDPARRSEERRIFSVADYIPPLETLHQWDFRAMLVKISPGVRLEELTDWRVGIEFVSHNGELKEALLHCRDLAFEGFRATCLNAGETLTSQGCAALPLTDHPLRYLYEPDPAIIRSGLFGELLAHLGLEAHRLDENIAYLTGDHPVESPWLHIWRIDEWMPFNLKKLRARLLERQIGAVTVKKRGSPILPEDLQKMLRLKKAVGHALVVLTQLGGQPIVLINYNS